MDWREFEHEHRAMIAVAEAGWRGSPCWHVLDWMCWKLRLKYPLTWPGGGIVTTVVNS